MADAVDIEARLPGVWSAVRAGRVEAWVARKIAAATSDLSEEKAHWVDAAVADVVGSLPPGRLLDSRGRTRGRVRPGTGRQKGGGGRERPIGVDEPARRPWQPHARGARRQCRRTPLPWDDRPPGPPAPRSRRRRAWTVDRPAARGCRRTARQPAGSPEADDRRRGERMRRPGGRCDPRRPTEQGAARGGRLPPPDPRLTSGQRRRPGRRARCAHSPAAGRGAGPPPDQPAAGDRPQRGNGRGLLRGIRGDRRAAPALQAGRRVSVRVLDQSQARPGPHDPLRRAWAARSDRGTQPRQDDATSPPHQDPWWLAGGATSRSVHLDHTPRPGLHHRRHRDTRAQGEVGPTATSTGQPRPDRYRRHHDYQPHRRPARHRHHGHRHDPQRREGRNPRPRRGTAAARRPSPWRTWPRWPTAWRRPWMAPTS